MIIIESRAVSNFVQKEWKMCSVGKMGRPKINPKASFFLILSKKRLKIWSAGQTGGPWNNTKVSILHKFNAKRLCL